MELTNEVMAYLLDMIKDELAELADLVYVALDDDKIDWAEGLMIGNKGMSAAANIMGALKKLGDVGVGQFIEVLEHSDLKFTSTNDNPFK